MLGFNQKQCISLYIYFSDNFPFTYVCNTYICMYLNSTASSGLGLSVCPRVLVGSYRARVDQIIPVNLIQFCRQHTKCLRTFVYQYKELLSHVNFHLMLYSTNTCLDCLPDCICINLLCVYIHMYVYVTIALSLSAAGWSQRSFSLFAHEK